jgi:fluoroacetyl-CoA thioesterase
MRPSSMTAEDEPPLGRTDTWLAPGTTTERLYTVNAGDTALAMGGDLPVLATPMLINWTELVASDLIRDRSGANYASVGTRVEVRHTDTAAVGDRIKVGVRVLSSIFRMVRFAVTVTHAETNAILLKGEHDRALVRRPV